MSTNRCPMTDMMIMVFTIRNVLENCIDAVASFDIFSAIWNLLFKQNDAEILLLDRLVSPPL